MPSNQEIRYGDLQATVAKLQEDLTKTLNELGEAQSLNERLRAEIAEGERLLEAHEHELQAQRVKHDRDKDQLAQAATIAMRQRDAANEQARKMEGRAALFQAAAETLEIAIEKLWRIIQNQQPAPPLPGELPTDYDRPPTD